ncbi:uncharacterized protein ATC70_008869 [Mucor velutinosus]|uniref:Uncharacterized protein n=1 Tax=Mucor velutinosus TaxID=708070 RepID=A0AAN7I269_9FUNG|nr:hypothetical protein ATC70_008869 [Mucor velutinosus]
MPKQRFAPKASTLKAFSALAVKSSNVSNEIVALKFVEGSKKARRKKILSSDELDDRVVELLKIQVYEAYQYKWKEFFGKPGPPNTVDDFKKTLSTKSLPNKAVSNVQIVIEKELGDIQPRWNHQKKLAKAQAAASKTGELSVNESSGSKEGDQALVNLKLTLLAEGSRSEADIVQVGGAGIGETTSGTMVHETEELRSASRSLKTMNHPRFDYKVLHDCVREPSLSTTSTFQCNHYEPSFARRRHSTDQI